MKQLTQSQLDEAFSKLPDFKTYPLHEYHISILEIDLRVDEKHAPDKDDSKTAIFRKNFTKGEWEFVAIS